MSYLIYNIFLSNHSLVYPSYIVNMCCTGYVVCKRYRESYLTMPSVGLSPVPRTLAGRTANIDINKSIAPDIPFQARTPDFSGANNRAPTLRYRRSSMTLPVLYFPPYHSRAPDVVPSEFTAPR